VSSSQYLATVSLLKHPGVLCDNVTSPFATGVRRQHGLVRRETLVLRRADDRQVRQVSHASVARTSEFTCRDPRMSRFVIRNRLSQT